MSSATEQIKSTDANVANRRLDRLCRLLYDPRLLAADSPACRILALAPEIAVQNTPARVDGNVGSRDSSNNPVARVALQK